MHAAFGGHTVDNIERVVVVERTNTANTHSGTTGRRAIGRDVHTRNLALHGFHRVILVLLLQVAHAHHAHRTRQVCLALCGIAGYNEFLQLLRVFRHQNFHIGLGRQG